MSTAVTRAQVERMKKLVALGRNPNEHEGRSAREKAAEMLRAIDVEYLETLQRQREELVVELLAEGRRLLSADQRATKRVTGALVTRAHLLLRHYRGADALPAAIELLRQMAEE